MALPELFSRMRRMSTPVFKVCRPLTIVKLSMYEKVVPISASRVLSLSVSKAEVVTVIGDVP